MQHWQVAQGGVVMALLDVAMVPATGTFKFLSGLPVGDRRVHSPEASD